MITSKLQTLTSAALAQLSEWLCEIRQLNQGTSLVDYLLARSGAAQPARSLLYLLWQTYGDDEEILRSKLSNLNAQCGRFLDLYGDGLVNVLRAPARINILGEHIDYVSYLPTASLPFGSREHDMIMLYRATEEERVDGASMLEAYPPFNFRLGAVPPAKGKDTIEGNWLSYLYGNPPPASHWGNYVKGAVYFARAKYGEPARRGFTFLVDSSIPPSGGASSSSALTVLAGAAIREANRISYTPEELAQDSAQAEWYVGTRGGSLDHTAICLAARGHGVRISYRDQQTRLVPLPDERYRWVTFFSHPADKGREVMIEYNERVAVSRVLIPAVIDGWELTQTDHYLTWCSEIEVLQAGGSTRALGLIELLLNELPQTLSLTEVEQNYPEAFLECSRLFPALLEERGSLPLKVRDRALHHLGEVRRVQEAERTLDKLFRSATSEETILKDFGVHTLGRLLNESHGSLRDLYEVSTPEVERLIEILLSDPNVYGARLMGGGFGGNVLALTTRENVATLIDHVQSEFYTPRQRAGVREGAVMVSTPGEGLSRLGLEAVWRAALEQFNALGQEAERYRNGIGMLLDSITTTVPALDVWPVIVAAGRGTRARATGMSVPKPLAEVAGLPAVRRVLRVVQRGASLTHPPIIIVSPETEPGVRQALEGEEVIFVLQLQAHGTGDAVLCAEEQMRGFTGLALIMWSTQPVVRVETVRRTLVLAALFDDYKMFVPTALKPNPYAPISRNQNGQVLAARETHLENADSFSFGETNIGLFVLKSEAMFAQLQKLRRRYWNEAEQRYTRSKGELGFPNELIGILSEHETKVLASPIADNREEQGIKGLEDIARCEQFIEEMETQKSGVRSQESEGRSPKSEVRSRESGNRRQESGVRSQESGVRSQKAE